ncbi:MAG: recombinase family protein [Candidatus Cryptobacteroides sp.]
MSNIAYIRVSTEMQNSESQTFEIRNYCNATDLKIDKWVEESASGTIPWEKRRLGKTIRKMQPGDLIVCTEISRLGRNMLMIMSILNYCSQRHIRIHTIKDSFDLSDNINSRIIAFAFALAAEIERNLISQRTKEALAARKKSGIRLGRPKGCGSKVVRICNNSREIEEMLASGRSLTAVAADFKVHRNTLARCRRHNYDLKTLSESDCT